MVSDLASTVYRRDSLWKAVQHRALFSPLWIQARKTHMLKYPALTTGQAMGDDPTHQGTATDKSCLRINATSIQSQWQAGSGRSLQWGLVQRSHALLKIHAGELTQKSRLKPTCDKDSKEEMAVVAQSAQPAPFTTSRSLEFFGISDEMNLEQFKQSRLYWRDTEISQRCVTVRKQGTSEEKSSR